MKKIVCILMPIIIAFFTTSCEIPKQEVQKLAMVLAMGVDLTPKNKYLMTVQVFNPEGSSGVGTAAKNQTQGAGQNIIILKAEGDTPYDAINYLSAKYGRNLYFGHRSYIVLGRSLAKSGVALFVDSAFRSPETRPDNILLLTKGRASKIVEAKTTDEELPSYTVENLIKMQEHIGYAPIISRLDFANALLSKTQSPILGIINLNKGKNSDERFNLSGTAVFRKDKLIGYLGADQTKGMQWINGKVSAGTMSIKSKKYGNVTFSVLKSGSNSEAAIKNGDIKIIIDIKLQSSIVEMDKGLDVMKDPSLMDKLGEEQSKAIKKLAISALNLTQKRYNADVFDFGGMIHRTYPEKWKDIQKNWKKIFPKIKVQVSVISDVKSAGIISKPIVNSSAK